MKRGEILGKTIFDYRTFFHNKDVDEYKQTMTAFIRESEAVPDDEFFAKFNQKFATVEILHKALSRGYLQKIASNLVIIKTLMIIYFLLTIIAGIAIASQLS